ncbi:hypothetical protein HYY74_02480 [Candidatus Woesearchaeota archaeon]|nr:hypothetical protein [Candidatus Woesearchaeota archaeon]
MLRLRFLNSREVRGIASIVERQWGARLPDSAFLINSRNKLHLISRDVGRLDLQNLRVNSAGLYFGELKDEAIRLSIEGSQLLGPSASKNVVEISGEEMRQWLRGEDLMKDCPGCSGFVILRRNSDYLGCGRYANGRIKNFVPKTRRVKSSA